MQKIENTVIELEAIKHKFYCDKCKRLIGESIEDEDGCYDELGVIDKRIEFISGNRLKDYHFYLNICEDCREIVNKEIDKKIENTLKKLGFVLKQ